MYIAPGQGRQPLEDQFWCQQKGLITLPICCKFPRNLFEVWFYTFFHDLIHIYSPGAGGIQSPGDSGLMSTETSCHFGHLLLISKSWLQQFLKNQLFSLFPIQKHKGPNLTLLSAQGRLWSDWADAQADLSLRWADTHFVDFVMSWLKWSRPLLELGFCFGLFL